MLRLALVLASASLLGCGIPDCYLPDGGVPPEGKPTVCSDNRDDPDEGMYRVDLRVNNQYAESLFRVSYAGVREDGTPFSGVAIDDERVGGGSSRTFSDVIQGRTFEPIDLTVSAVSLGERQSFPVHLADMKNQALEITYDYDLATANFVIGYSWPKRE